MKFPMGLLEALAGIAVQEVVTRVGGGGKAGEIIGAPRADETKALVDSVVSSAIEHDDVDFERFSAEMILELLTEERSDQFLDLLLEKISLPLGVGSILRKALDSQLPEVIRDPLLGILGYEVINDELVETAPEV